MSGLDTTGFTVKTLQDFIADMTAQYQAALGPSINLGPKTPQGQVIVNLAAELADLFELAEEVYNSFFPDTASGTSLDNVVAITGIARIPQSPSLVDVTITGTPGVTFASLKGHVAGDPTSSFTSVSGGTIGAGGTLDITFQSDSFGPVAAASGTLTEIDTPVLGIASMTNAEDATLGRLTETDAELRIRRTQELQHGNTATVEGMRTSLMNTVTDVIQARIIENDTDVVDGGGRPPHSIQVVVDGGLDQAVGNKIWATKPAGIQTVGATSVTVTDSQGIAHTINFDRPTPVPVYVTATLVRNTDPTEPPIYPVSGNAAVKAAIIAFFAQMTIGQDVITSQLYTPINTVAGILGITVYVGLAPAPISGANISIAATSRAVTDASKVVIS